MKALVMLALMALVGTAVIGCKASGEVDPHNAATIAAPQ
jgi:hypothetical protein